MDSNTHSVGAAEGPTALAGTDGLLALVGTDTLTALAAAVDALAAEDLDRLGDAAVAHQVLALQTLENRLHGLWLQRLATVDGRGAAGADRGEQAPSTAGWLRARLRLGASAATSSVRTARALFRGPLVGTAQALAAGELSAAHAQVLAAGVQDLPARVAAEAEPVLLEAAGRLDPPRLRRAVAHLRGVLDPEAADQRVDRQQQRRRLWVSPTWEGMVAVEGLLEPEAGQTLLAALEPLARPTDAGDARSGAQRTADALAELCRRQLEGGRLPQSGGVRPQLLVTVDLDSLVGRHGPFGGEIGAAGPLGAEACRRLACDGALTRVLVTRHPTHHDPGGAGGDGGLVARLLEVGRATRVVSAAQRAALVVRDGGCAVAGCDRPPAWCEAHHLRHWLHGGRTDLANLALVCRAHHRAVHEGGWRLVRDPDGRLCATPPHRRQPTVG
jgi:Domain of unknown function (DUF222)/HNH endonuclease